MKPVWLFSLATVAAIAAHDRPAVVLDAGQSVDGVSQSAYVERWWQWAMRLPDGVRAYQDPSGAQCGMNQSGPVWFLAGTEGTMRVDRRCEIPAGHYVFFPVIDLIAHSKPGKALDCRTAQAQARQRNDRLADAQVTLDGRPIPHIEAHRLHPPACFDAFAKAKYMEHPEAYGPAAADGYWLMLNPLSEGEHHLVVHARYGGADQDGLAQDFEYELKVVPAGKPTPTPQRRAPEAPPMPGDVIST